MPFLNNIGTVEWIIIGIALLFLFGNKKMNEMAKGLGESTKELKKAKQELEKAIGDTTEEVDKAKEEIKESIKSSLKTKKEPKNA